MNKDKYSTIIVVDIETLGKANNAKIATIGAVAVNLLSRELLGEFYVKCDLLQPGRSVNIDVLDWWTEQGKTNKQAHNEIFGQDGDRESLPRALALFSEFIEAIYHKGYRPQVMGNGPEFDNVILNDAYTQHNIETPWDFGCNQSLRTAVLFGRVFLGIDPKYQGEFTGIVHHALDDARHEANSLLTISKGFTT